MGRVRRQRRYKACDPFSDKKKNGNEDKYDKAPKGSAKADIHFEETKKYLRFQQKIECASNKNLQRKGDVIASNEHALKSKKIKKSKVQSSQKLPSETKKKYFEKLDRNVQEAIDQVIIGTKTLRKKRKEHLKARDIKKKNKQKSNDNVSDFSSLKDEVAFGDVAKQPPTILPVPRNATKQKKPRNLQLMSLLGENAVNKPTDNKKKRKNMNETERDEFDAERQQAIDAYRLLKKRKEMKDMT